MKKIFLISEYILPEQNTTGYLFHKLHVNLKKHYSEQLKLIVKEDPQHTIEENVILVKNVNLNKKNLVQRLIFELVVAFGFFWKILFNVKKGDVIFNVTNPTLLIPVIFFVKQFKNFKWILLVHDIFPENLIAAKVLKSNSIPYKILKFFFDKFYSSADQCIVIGQDMKNLVDKKISKDDSIIVQSWVDHNDIEVQPKEQNKILRNIGWQNNKPVFSFFGNIGRVQGIDNIIQALKLLPKEKRPCVLFIGSGAYEDELKQSIFDLKDENIQFIGNLEASRKSDGLSAGDIAVVTLAEGMYGLGVPSKAYYSMAADKPILSIMDEDSEVSFMVKKYNIGWTVQAGDPQKLATKFLEISQNFEKMDYRSPREVLIQNYSEQVAMQKIISVINKVIQK